MSSTSRHDQRGGNQTHVGGDSGSGNSVSLDAHGDRKPHRPPSVADYSDHSSSDSSYDNSSQHSASVFDNSHDTSLANSTLDNSHDLALASGNHLLGLLSRHDTRGNGGDRHGPRRFVRIRCNQDEY